MNKSSLLQSNAKINNPELIRVVSITINFAMIINRFYIYINQQGRQMLRFITIFSTLLLALSAHAQTEPKTLSDSDVTRYFVCGYLHQADSYKIASYLTKNYEMQWYTYRDKFRVIVDQKLAQIAREDNISKFRAEDQLSEKYQCNSAYIDLLGLSNIKI